jgi:hypothetical protein
MPLRRLFEEYEEIVDACTFSLLDEIEEKIEDLHLKVVFEDGSEAALADVQIYPTTDKVSFRVLKEMTSELGGTSEGSSTAIDISPTQALVHRPTESLAVEIKR